MTRPGKHIPRPECTCSTIRPAGQTVRTGVCRLLADALGRDEFPLARLIVRLLDNRLAADSIAILTEFDVACHAVIGGIRNRRKDIRRILILLRAGFLAVGIAIGEYLCFLLFR